MQKGWYNQMENVKTAISIQKALFDQAEDLARKMKVSRSRLFVLALEDYLRRQQNREMLAQINAAYADEPDPSEQMLRRKSKRQHRKIVEGEW
jgi:metal-responsive CopG/Arc/MetJ family transcriptional regulator